MGLTDWFDDVVNKSITAAGAALEAAEELVKETAQDLGKVIDDGEKGFNDIKNRVEERANQIEDEIQAAIPDFDSGLKALIDDIVRVASSAAENGLDITDAINGIVDTVFERIKKNLDAAIDTFDRLLQNAISGLSQVLQGAHPSVLDSLLEPVRRLISWLLDVIKGFSGKLKDGVNWAIDEIKKIAQNFVKQIGEVLGPVWDFIKKLWKLIFGTEPEQCELTAQWFDEKMKRTEHEMLSTGHQILIQRRTYLELLPAAKDSFKTVVSEYLGASPAFSLYQSKMTNLLAAPENEHLMECSLSEEHTDQLGGQQRVQIKVLHYRWRTEAFCKVSSGFLGIIAIVSAIGKDVGEERKESDRLKATRTKPRQLPLEIDPEMAVKIYQTIEKQLRLRDIESEQKPVYVEDKTADISRQIMRRDDEHGWIET